jgi:hypothetical protein
MVAELRAPATGGGGGGEDSPDSFVFEQDIAATIWNVTHNLGFHPAVTVVDTLDRTFEGRVDYLDENSLTITFATPLTGKAYLS